VSAATHCCPVRRCTITTLPPHLLMCGLHWRMVPPALRRHVTAAFDGGRGVGTLALFTAQAEAIVAVNDRLTGTRTTPRRNHA
jgi:hypothetical protein